MDAQGNQTGFHKPMGKQKPIPVRLQLRGEHVALMGKSISFTPAKFSTGDQEEKSIITRYLSHLIERRQRIRALTLDSFCPCHSSGPYVITWNFRRVKQGKLNDYSIKRYSADVVADQFTHSSDRNIIVTLPDDVTMVKAQSMAKVARRRYHPELDAGAPGDIVHSPF